MPSIIKTNDTLQITRDQGFPEELIYDQHKIKPFFVSDFEDRVFEFKDKPGIRIYQAPPVRNFLVENIDGKWLYWGLTHVLEVIHDYEKKITSGKYKLIYIYTPEEMKYAHRLIDRVRDTDYLGVI